MNNIYTKKRTHFQTSLFIWNSHTNNCNVFIQSLQKGKGGRRKKKLHEGVNRFSFAQLWTKEITNSLSKITPANNNDNTDLNISDYDIKFNPSLSLCKCLLCENIIKRPVMIEGCQHAFCLGCIVLKFEGRQLFECPYCLNPFSPQQVVPCKVRCNLVDQLQISCKCGELFVSKAKLGSHKINCAADKEGHMLTVGDLLSLDLDHQSIPESVEKATLRVLQHKIENSNTGTAEFPSGGPRVRTN